MNTSFDRFALVNTYGAFGTRRARARRDRLRGDERRAVRTSASEWRAYEFPCKPGDPQRRPCIVSPFQPRLDWQIWFAAMATPDQYPWTLHFVWKLLEGDRGVLRLLANDPFPEAPPRWVRARFYRYRFADPDDASGAWWTRELLGDWLPPLSRAGPRLRAEPDPPRLARAGRSRRGARARRDRIATEVQPDGTRVARASRSQRCSEPGSPSGAGAPASRRRSTWSRRRARSSGFRSRPA